MWASKPSDEYLYENYIDPTVYARPHDRAVTSLEADSSHPEYASPHQTSHIPHTTAHDTIHTRTIDPTRPDNEANPVYLTDNGGFEMELDATFGSNHIEKGAAEDDILKVNSYQAFVPEDIDDDVYPFSRIALAGDTWYDREAYSSYMRYLDDSTTLCTSPSTTSIFEVDPVYTEEAPGSEIWHKSNLSSAMSHPRILSTPSSVSEHDHHSQHLCHTCNRSFTLSKDLKRHMSSIHVQEKVPCPESGCRQAFSRRDKLLQHRRIHHNTHSNDEGAGALSQDYSALGESSGSGVRPMLEKSILDDQSPSLTQNRPVSPKKLYDCQFCGQQFSLQHDRLRHLRTLHRKQENYVYRCAVPGCTKGDKMFNRLDNFKQHLKNKHDQERLNELVRKSRTLGGETFTVTTPEMYSSSR